MFKKLILISIISTCALASRDKDTKINIATSPNGKYIAVAAAAKRPLKKSKSDSSMDPSSCLYSPESRRLIARCEKSRFAEACYSSLHRLGCQHQAPPLTREQEIENCKARVMGTGLLAAIFAGAIWFSYYMTTHYPDFRF